MKVLFLTHRLPYAPNRGDRIRSYHLLRSLRGKAELHLFSLVESGDSEHFPGMRRDVASLTVARPPMALNKVRGLLALPGCRPLTHVLLDAPGIHQQLKRLVSEVRPDVVFAYCSGMARFALDAPLRSLPCVLDMVDVDSEKWRALALTSTLPWRWIYAREARVLREFEAEAAARAAVTVVVNAREKHALDATVPSASVVVVENGVDVEFFRPRAAPAPARNIVFCGVMDYTPNVDGVLWFVRHVWPAVRSSYAEARFVVVGARPVEAIRRLARSPGIVVSGSVPDVRPYLWDGAVSIAPLAVSRGLQNKVLEALAAGLPVLATGVVRDGLPDVVRPGCRFADTPPEWIDALLLLLREAPEERRRMSERANLLELSWDARLAAIPRLLADAAGGSHYGRSSQ